jgi:large subunit ribosomal protein L6
MSRIGKKPIEIPKGVTVTATEGLVTVKGPKGEMTHQIHPGLLVTVEGSELVLKNPDHENRALKSAHGLSRTLLANAVTGVSTGFTKSLEIIGVGYRAVQQGKGIQLQLGYSHPIDIAEIPDITIDVEADNRAKTNFIHVRGVDRQKVGQVAANLRELRPPEPYKGKGVRYIGEKIQRKMGKAGKAGK